MKTIILIFSIIGLCAFGFKDPEEQRLKFVNQLPNGGCENAQADWSESGGTFSVTTTAADVGSGQRACSWDASAASQTLLTDARAVPNSLETKNCEASLRYKGGDTNLKAVVVSGASTLAETDLIASTGYTDVKINFICPDSANVQIGLEASADAAVVYVDDAYWGEATNLSDIAQSELFVDARYDATTSCAWSRTSTSLGGFGADADCPAITVTRDAPGLATVDTTDDDLPNLTIDNVPPGVYEVTVYIPGAVQTASTAANFALDDGTTTTGQVGFTDGSIGFAQALSLTGVFEYTTAQSTVTWSIHGSASSGAVTIEANSQERDVHFVVKRFPLESQKVLAPENSGWYIDANIGGTNVNLGTGAISSYTQIASGSLDLVKNPGSADVQIACDAAVSTGLTCSGNELYGITVDAPKTGTLEVCSEATVSVAGATAEFAFQVVQTNEGSSTIAKSGNARSAFTANTSAGTDQKWFKSCGYFPLTSAGRTSFKLYVEKTTSTGQTVITDRSASVGQRDMRFTARYVTDQHKAVVVDQVVTAGGQDQFNLVSAVVDMPGTPATIREHGDWISSYTDVGVGNVTINVKSGVFTSAPACTCSTAVDASTGSTCIVQESATSTSAVRVITREADGTPTNVDVDFHVICHGPR